MTLRIYLSLLTFLTFLTFRKFLTFQTFQQIPKLPTFQISQSTTTRNLDVLVQKLGELWIIFKSVTDKKRDMCANSFHTYVPTH